MLSLLCWIPHAYNGIGSIYTSLWCPHNMAWLNCICFNLWYGFCCWTIRTPLVSFLYERGWRQSFSVLGGFPGPEKEVIFYLPSIHLPVFWVLYQLPCVICQQTIEINYWIEKSVGRVVLYTMIEFLSRRMWLFVISFISLSKKKKLQLQLSFCFKCYWIFFM